MTDALDVLVVGGGQAGLAMGYHLASVGAGYETVRESIDASAYPMPGQLVDVGGHRLHLHCTGSGSPTVVLEPGLGEISSIFGWIAPAVAADTQVCVYDRAGRGWSESGAGPQDMTAGKVSLTTPSVLVSVLALVFTIGSFWWIQVRRGRLRRYTSHVYSGSFAPKKLMVVLPLVLHNPAPVPLVITDLRLRISAASTEHAAVAVLPIYLRWIASHASVYPDNDTRRYAAPFPVVGRKAIDRYVESQRDDPVDAPRRRSYVATVEALVMPRRRHARLKLAPAAVVHLQHAARGTAARQPNSAF